MPAWAAEGRRGGGEEGRRGALRRAEQSVEFQGAKCLNLVVPLAEEGLAWRKPPAKLPLNSEWCHDDPAGNRAISRADLVANLA